MIRKYHNHKLQTTLWLREEEPLNHHETPGRQFKQSNQLSLPYQDDCNTRTDTKQQHTTKYRTITDSHNGSNNKQKVNNNRTALRPEIRIRMNYKQTRVWIQDICKKSTVLAKKYWENTLFSINIVIDDRLACNVNKVYKYMILVLSIYAFLITMGLLI